jgi:class 3 adenylate cyclase
MDETRTSSLKPGQGRATRGILFVDVAGSTGLYDLLGDAAASAAVLSCLGAMAEMVSEHGGTVIERIGDEVMAAFEDPTAIFDGAVAVQCKVDAMPPIASPMGEVKLRVRVGFHIGPVIIENGNYFGQTINIAARLVGLAKGGQIFTAVSNAPLFKETQRLKTRELGSLLIKGRPDGIEVLEIEWRESPDRTVVSALTTRPLTAACKKLRLSYAGREWLFDGRDTVVLGRDSKSDVVLLDGRASRAHARIERRRDKWVFVDQSTNGTFVGFSGQAQIWLHHQEVALDRPGILSVGAADEGGQCVQFALE